MYMCSFGTCVLSYVSLLINFFLCLYSDYLSLSDESLFHWSCSTCHKYVELIWSRFSFSFFLILNSNNHAQGVSRALVENSRTLRLPTHLHERLSLIRNAKIRLEERGITPSIDVSLTLSFHGPWAAQTVINMQSQSTVQYLLLNFLCLVLPENCWMS